MGAFGGEGSTADGFDGLLKRMERDELDLVAVGRALISDPAWVEKVWSGDLAGLKGFDAAALAELV